MAIRRLREEHIPGCTRIIVSLPLFQGYGYTEEVSRTQLQRALTDPRAEVLVAALGEEPIGIAWLVHRGAFDWSGYLRLLAVDGEHHRMGVGQRLMVALEQMHITRGGIALLANATNTNAQAFYEALGYKQVGALPGYVRPGKDELIYFKWPPRAGPQ